MSESKPERVTGSAASDDDMVTWTCYQWPRQCGHDDDLACMTTEVAIKQRLETFEVPDA